MSAPHATHPHLDDDLVAYARSPVALGAKTIHVADRCVERAVGRERATVDPEHVRLRLRQRIECGRFRRSPPPGLVADLHGRWDAFVDCDGLLFCLTRRPEPRSFDAVTCFDPACATWRVCCSDQHDRLAGAEVIVDVSAHAVQRYVERVRASAGAEQARRDLRRVLADESRVLPELPHWLAGEAHEDRPYYLVFGGWLVVPLAFTDGSSHRFTALTCLGRGLGARANAAARRPRRAERAQRLAAEAVVVRVAEHRRLRRKRRAPAAARRRVTPEGGDLDA